MLSFPCKDRTEALFLERFIKRMKSKKFIQKIMKQIKNGQNELNIVNDKMGTPTYTHDFAINVKLIIEKGIKPVVIPKEKKTIFSLKQIIS